MREAIALILGDRREESLGSLPPDAGQELVVLGDRLAADLELQDRAEPFIDRALKARR